MIVGIFLMMIGVLGLILPVIPGWPFFFLGLSLAVPSAAFSLKYQGTHVFLKRDIIYLREWRKKGVVVGVTTKFFPLHIKKADELGLEANQFQFQKALETSKVTVSHKITFPGRFVYLHQVHGAHVEVLEQGNGQRYQGFRRLAETDGVVINIPGLTLLAMSADCLSIFFSAPGWAGIVHAGWRGSHQKISQNAVKLILEKSGCKPSDVHVIFGPAICGRHYRVGPEFKAHFSGPALQARRGKFYFDLVRENRDQIQSMGVPEENFSDTSLCTVSHHKYFYSFRTEKEHADRMVSFIQLESLPGRS